MTTKDEMEWFLRTSAKYQMESGQAGLPALLLERGSWFEGRADSDEYAVTKRWKKIGKPKAQDCLYNSQECCAEDNGTRYFEGFVLVQTGMLPSEHAWVVMQDGRVVDFTLEAAEVILAQKRHRLDLRTPLYVGVEIPRTFIMERWDATGWYDLIAELFYADHIKQLATR